MNPTTIVSARGKLIMRNIFILCFLAFISLSSFSYAEELSDRFAVDYFEDEGVIVHTHKSGIPTESPHVYLTIEQPESDRSCYRLVLNIGSIQEERLLPSKCWFYVEYNGETFSKAVGVGKSEEFSKSYVSKELSKADVCIEFSSVILISNKGEGNAEVDFVRTLEEFDLSKVVIEGLYNQETYFDQEAIRDTVTYFALLCAEE